MLHPAPRRIAVFRAIFLGDLLVAVPALRAVRAAYPDAEISLIGLPWAASFVARFRRYVDRFVEFPGYPGLNEVPFDPDRTARFLAEQRARPFDLAIQMHGSGGASNPFVLALGARVAAGYCLGDPPAGLTLAAPYPEDQPEIWRNLGLARLVGATALDPRLEFPLTPADHAEADQLLAPLPAGAGPLVVLHPGAKAPARRWPIANFAAVGDRLERDHGAQIIITGSRDEQPLAQELAARLRRRPLNLAGATALGGLAAILARSAILIGNDTGPAHLADALATPSVTIFGPADLRRWAPLDTARHPSLAPTVACPPDCGSTCAADQRCLRSVTPDAVTAAATQLSTRANRRPALAGPATQ